MRVFTRLRTGCSGLYLQPSSHVPDMCICIYFSHSCCPCSHHFVPFARIIRAIAATGRRSLLLAGKLDAVFGVAVGSADAPMTPSIDPSAFRAAAEVRQRPDLRSAPHAARRIPGARAHVRGILFSCVRACTRAVCARARLVFGERVSVCVKPRNAMRRRRSTTW